MKKIALLIFFALLMQEGKTQVAWDSIGAGLPSPNGTWRTWNINGRLYSSTSNLNANLFEFTQGGWSQVFSSSINGQILDMEFDSINNQVFILGKFGDLTGPVNSGTFNGMAVWDLSTEMIYPVGGGVNFPAEYTYEGLICDSKLFVIGRFEIVSNNDTIANIMSVDLQTGTYSKVCSGNVNNLIRDIVVFSGDTIVAGSFVWNGYQYPLAKVTASGFDFSVSGPCRGFALSITKWNDEIVFAGDVTDTLGSGHFVGAYNGNSSRTLAETNESVRTVEVFNNDLYVGGKFSSITDSFGVTTPVNNLARLRNTWDDVLGGCVGGGFLGVMHLFPAHDTLYVSGEFSQSGQIPTLNVSRLIAPLPNSLFENIEASQGLSVYPNPNNGQFTASFWNINEEGSVLVEIFDVAGRKIEEFNSSLPVSADIELPNGLYVLKVREQVVRFVIRK